MIGGGAINQGYAGSAGALPNSLIEKALAVSPFSRIEAELEASERLFWRVSELVDILLGGVPVAGANATAPSSANGVLGRVEQKASNVGDARRQAQEQLDRLAGALS